KYCWKTVAANGGRRIHSGHQPRTRSAYRVCERGPTPSWQGSPARHSVSIENSRGDVRSRSYRRFTPLPHERIKPHLETESLILAVSDLPGSVRRRQIVKSLESGQ